MPQRMEDSTGRGRKPPRPREAGVLPNVIIGIAALAGVKKTREASAEAEIGRGAVEANGTTYS